MAVTYTGNLKLGLPTTGTESGTWGDVVNNQITTLVDQSISGTVSLTSMTNADYTLTNGNGNAANEARYMALLVPSSLTLTANRNILVPSTSKMYVVKNATTGGFSVVVKTSAGTGIEVPNGNEMLLYCDGTNVVVAFDTINVNSVNGGPLAGLRNRVINGAMALDQRNAGASVTPATGDYLTDRWQYASSQASKVSAIRATGSNLTGFPYTLKFTSLSAYAVTTSDYFVTRQKVEGFNVADLAWGTASAKTITVSFWVYSTLTGTFGGTVLNNAADRSYAFTYTINSASTWEYKTVTIAGDTTGTWLTDSNVGLNLQFGLGAGSTVSKTAGSWGAGVFYSATGAVSVVGTNAATWYISGVQLEVGSVATTFEQRPIGLELALCQRYYFRAGAGLGNGFTWPATSGFADSISVAQLMMPFPTPMRIAPTALEQSGTAANYAVRYAAGSATDCSAVPAFGNATVYGALFVFTVASTLTAGQAVVARTGSASGNSAYLGWSAEL